MNHFAAHLELTQHCKSTVLQYKIKIKKKRYMHPSVHSSTIYNSQDMEATSVSINRGMDKEDVVYMYNGMLLGHKKTMK